MDKTFSKILRAASLIDYEDRLELSDMCKILSQEFERLQGLDRTMVEDLLRKRENDYSTALSPFVAIPHFRLDGEGKFYMVIMRCRGGIKFSSLYPSIKAVFAFCNTPDQRQIHLYALSTIVRISNRVNFEKHWLQAENVEKLKRILISNDSTNLFVL